MTDQPKIDGQTALWREQIAAKPITSCGRLDMQSYLPSPARVGRVESDVVRYVYFEDGSECIVLGQLADFVAFRAADYGAVVAERDAARAEVQQCRVEIKALCDENEAIMRAVGEAHEALRRGMKNPCIAEAKPQPGEGHVGVSGERDPDHPCEEFRPGTPGTAGNCYGDGHFLCQECGHLNKPQGEGGVA